MSARIASQALSCLILISLPECKKSSTAPSEDSFRIVQTGSLPGSAVAGSTVSVVFLVTNSSTGAPASGKTVTVTVTAGGGTVASGSSTTATTGVNGTVSVSWHLGTALGAQSLRGSIGTGATANADVQITATQPPATVLAITTAPGGNAVSGVALSPQPVLQLKDANGNNVPSTGVAVTAALESGGGALSGTTTVNTNAGGTATFTDLAITGSAGNRVLRFTATADGNSLAVSSSQILLAPPPALSIATAPSPAPNTGIPFFSQPVIQLKDGNGNNVAQAGVAVTVAQVSGPGTLGSPPASGAAIRFPDRPPAVASLTVMTDATGKAAFSDLTITSVSGGGAVTLQFSAPGYLPVTSGTLALNGSAATNTATNGVETGRLVASAGTQLYFSVVVPADAVDLAFLLFGGTGNAELYARRSTYPTSSTFDCRSNAAGPTQRCDIASNRGGQWYIVINAAGPITDELFRVLSYGPNCPVIAMPFNTTVNGTLSASDCKVPFRFVLNSLYDRYLYSPTTTQSTLFQFTTTNTIALSLKQRDLSRWYVTNMNGSSTTTTPLVFPAGDYEIDVYDFTFANVGGQTYSVKPIAGAVDFASCNFLAAPFGLSSLSLTLATTDCTGYTAGAKGDRILVVAQGYQTLTITMSSTAFDPYLRLIDRQSLNTSTGNVVAENDNGGGGTTARIVYTNPSADVGASVDYTIEATSATAGATGTYTLSITVGPAHYSAPPAQLRTANARRRGN